MVTRTQRRWSAGHAAARERITAVLDHLYGQIRQRATFDTFDTLRQLPSISTYGAAADHLRRLRCTPRW